MININLKSRKISYLQNIQYLQNFYKNINWVNHHGHYDKSYTNNIISMNDLQNSSKHMVEKWKIMKNIKQKYKDEDIYKRINHCVQHLYNQGCKKQRTFIDIDKIVGLRCIEQALKVKQEWGNHVELQIATQPLDGLSNIENKILFEKAVLYTDLVGCLPSRDKDFEEHLDIAFYNAKKNNKHIEAHLDQQNKPIEKETEIFCDFVEKYNYKNKARAIHSISLSCFDVEYQREIAKRLKKLNIGVIICPSAAISMTQHNEYITPTHNSIAPLNILLDENVNVGLGIDNIQDVFMPLCDGNISFELRLLAEATRNYDINILKKIAENDMGFI